MHGYEVLSLEVQDQSLTARVRFSRADGTVKEARYSWPKTTSRREIEKVLEEFWAQFLAEPARPPVLHEAMDLVGQPQVLGTPGSEASS